MRQAVVGRYIVDFLAPQIGLVVEVDGGYHARIAAADARRQATLRAMGFCVLRLPSELVESQLSAAVAAVRRALGG